MVFQREAFSTNSGSAFWGEANGFGSCATTTLRNWSYSRRRLSSVSAPWMRVPICPAMNATPTSASSRTSVPAKMPYRYFPRRRGRDFCSRRRAAGPSSALSALHRASSSSSPAASSGSCGKAFSGSFGRVRRSGGGAGRFFFSAAARGAFRSCRGRAVFFGFRLCGAGFSAFGPRGYAPR